MKIASQHSLSQWWQLLKKAVSAWSDDYAPSMGAALSYYSVFSMAPLLLIVIVIAGLVFGQEAARGEVFAQLQGLMGDEAAKGIENLLAGLNKPSRGVTASIVGVGALLIGATTVFGELQDALDRIWRAPVRERTTGIWALIRARFLAFGMILGIAFLLMVSLVLSAAVAALGKWWGGFFGSWEAVLQVVNFVVGFALTTSVFAMIYKLMPRVDVQWHDVWLGAAITALMFTVGRVLIGVYIGKSGVASGFGAAGSIAIVFVWVYYSAQIFLLGAEFTWVYANEFGSLRHQGADPRSAAPQPAAVPSRASVAPPTPEPGPGLAPVPAQSMPVPAGADSDDRHDAPAPPWPSSPGHRPAVVGLGLAVGLAFGLRYVLPKLLRRATREFV